MLISAQGNSERDTVGNIELWFSLLGVKGKLINDHKVVIGIILQYINLLYVDYVTICM